MKIRRASAGDAIAVGSVKVASWKTTYAGIVHQSYLDKLDPNERSASFLNRLSNASLDSYVLLDDSDRVVGLLDLGPNRDPSVTADGELYAIYILQDFQGRGGGRLLFEHAVARARERAFRQLVISVFEANTSSRHFYEHMGATLVGSDHVEIEGHRYATSTYVYEVV